MGQSRDVVCQLTALSDIHQWLEGGDCILCERTRLDLNYPTQNQMIGDGGSISLSRAGQASSVGKPCLLLAW